MSALQGNTNGVLEMKKFKDRWSMSRLYRICAGYLNNQTEEGAIRLIEEIENFKETYPISEFGLNSED